MDTKHTKSFLKSKDAVEYINPFDLERVDAMSASDTVQSSPFFITPEWQPLKGVHALMTTRLGGVSPAPYDSMNLGTNTQDVPQNIAKNKQRLQGWLNEQSDQSPGMQVSALGFLKQVHGIDVVNMDAPKIKAQIAAGEEPEGDACYSTTAGVVCAVRVADCMPILLAVPGGVAAIHAGWRSLAGGVIIHTLQHLLHATGQTAQDVVAWLGPCIGGQKFEVGEDVKCAFERLHSENTCAFQTGNTPDKWWADLPLLARLEFKRAGVEHVYTDGRCTVTEEALFYSYRRDQKRLGDTGRMAACIWLEPNNKG